MRNCEAAKLELQSMGSKGTLCIIMTGLILVCWCGIHYMESIPTAFLLQIVWGQK